MDGWSGHLLIAPAWMTDPNFARTVVLLLHHDGQGAFGLVLNRPTRTSVEELWRKAAGSPCATQETVYLGGPVPGPLIALHEHAALGDRTPVDGIYVTSEPQRLGDLLAEPRERMRVFAGYSGWGEGQLERELQDAAWVTVPALATDVFAPQGEHFWRQALRRGTGAARDPFAAPGGDEGPAAEAN